MDLQCSDWFNRYCCKRKSPEHNICQSTCVFESCSVDSDCAPEECCDHNDQCSSGDCLPDHVAKGIASWIIAVIVISIIIFIVIPVAVVIFCCCCAAAFSRTPAYGGVIVSAQPATTGIAAVSAPAGQPMYVQNSQPHPKQPAVYQPTVYPHNPPMIMTTQT